MRIIAGRFRGRALASLGKGDPKSQLRPTSDRVRESLFSALQAGQFNDPITGARVLDLFAGTGALGLEALSRGAAHVTFVENGRLAQSLIRKNVETLSVASETNMLRQDATRLRINSGLPYDLIFLDPPYGRGLGQKALANDSWIAPGALVVWEENAPQEAPEGFTHRDLRRYGDTYVTILEASA